MYCGLHFQFCRAHITREYGSLLHNIQVGIYSCDIIIIFKSENEVRTQNINAKFLLKMFLNLCNVDN
jgi:hypothetical protein